MPTGDAYSSGHQVPSLWDLHVFYLLRPIFFWTCRYFTGLCSSNIPRYFLDFASQYGPYSHLFNHVLETFTVSLYSTEMNTRRSYDLHVWSSCQRFANKESNTSASYLDLLLSIGRDGQLHSSIYDKRDDFNFHITIFRSWVAIYQPRPPMASLFRSLYGMPGLAPRMDVLSWGRRDFQLSFSNRDTSRNAWNRHWGSFMINTGILSNNMKFPSHKC